MTKKKWLLIALPALLSIGVLLFVLRSAPATSRFYIPGIASDHLLDCQRNEAGNCLQVPAVTGIDLDSQPIAFPEAFQTEYVLVVMPFDREQQVRAETWLPYFQELASEYPGLSYYSIAALPELNAAVRVLVIGGMSAGIRDPLLRGQMAVLFLEDQASFLDALEIEQIDSIQVLVVNAEGTVFWRGAGDYAPATAEELSHIVENLLD